MNQLISNVLMQPRPTGAVERPLTLIEKLEDCANFYANDPKCKDDDLALGIAQGVNLALNIVKQHSDWVSVGERLPSDRGYFLVRLNTGDITVDYYDCDNSYWSKNYGNVTHFMRLPQPPSEVQDD